jgi:hypothetical protein
LSRLIIFASRGSAPRQFPFGNSPVARPMLHPHQATHFVQSNFAAIPTYESLFASNFCLLLYLQADPRWRLPVLMQHIESATIKASPPCKLLVRVTIPCNVIRFLGEPLRICNTGPSVPLSLAIVSLRGARCPCLTNPVITRPSPRVLKRPQTCVVSMPSPIRAAPSRCGCCIGLSGCSSGPRTCFQAQIRGCRRRGFRYEYQRSSVPRLDPPRGSDRRHSCKRRRQ